jgi:hypothetical protein
MHVFLFRDMIVLTVRREDIVCSYLEETRMVYGRVLPIGTMENDVFLCDKHLEQPKTLYR